MESTEYAAHDGLGLAQLIAEREVTAAEVVAGRAARARGGEPADQRDRALDGRRARGAARRAAQRPVRRRAVPAEGPRPRRTRACPTTEGCRALAERPRDRARDRRAALARRRASWCSARRTRRSSAPRASPSPRCSARAQPVGPDPHAGRLLRRGGGRGRGRDRAGRRRQRRRRLDPHPGRVLRPGRAQGRARADAVRPGRQRAAARRGDQRRRLAQRARQRRDARRARRPGRDRPLRAGACPPDPFLDAVGATPGGCGSASTPRGAQRRPAPGARVARSTTRRELLESLGHEVEAVAPPYDDAALAATS